jgi:hypothetical protein
MLHRERTSWSKKLLELLGPRPRALLTFTRARFETASRAF